MLLGTAGFLEDLDFSKSGMTTKYLGNIQSHDENLVPLLSPIKHLFLHYTNGRKLNVKEYDYVLKS